MNGMTYHRFIHWTNAWNIYFAQNDKGLYMIDQHAAQERINYEYFRDKVGRVAQEARVTCTVPYHLTEFYVSKSS